VPLPLTKTKRNDGIIFIGKYTTLSSRDKEASSSTTTSAATQAVRAVVQATVIILRIRVKGRRRYQPKKSSAEEAISRRIS